MALSGKKTYRLISLLLLVVFCSTLLSPIALARASYYINACDAYMTVGSSGNVTAWFDITGTGTMDEIGATKITIY